MAIVPAFEEPTKKDRPIPQDYATASGIPLAPVYGPQGPLFSPDETKAEVPGRYPFSRGPYFEMYRSRLWTMRLFAGFGTPEQTNERFRKLLSSGGSGLSIAFDLPTLMGRDSDDPASEGEVGKCGVAVDTVEDFLILLKDIDLTAVTTSMTINGPAAMIMAMFVASLRIRGIPEQEVGGTIQNDIFKEYQAQKEYIYPPRPSLRLCLDLVRFVRERMPKFHPISVSGYHIREAGSTAVEELAFTLANGIAYLEGLKAMGIDPESAAQKFSFFFNSHSDFFEEIAKFRAARRIWAKWLRERLGITEEGALRLRFHAQTSGASLTAQQPLVNVVRTSLECLAAVLGGAQSIHTNSYDEVLALPTEQAARLALRTQQVIAYESNVAAVSDPLGGSYFLEWLTDEMESRAAAILEKIEEMGGGSMLEGVLAGIENGYFQERIASSAYEQARRTAEGAALTVGVNAFLEGNEQPPPEILKISEDVAEKQRANLKEVKARRSAFELRRALEKLAEAAQDPTAPLMEPLIEAALARASLGEMVAALARVFGTYRERAAI